MSNNNSTIVSDFAHVSANVSANEERRFRTSPRTNAFEEVLAIVKKHIEFLSKDDSESPESIAARIDTAEYIRSRVEELIGTKHNNKNIYDGRHYIGLTSSGSKKIFQHYTKPTQHTHGLKYVAVAGPFRKKAEADFIVREGLTPKGVLFGDMK